MWCVALCYVQDSCDRKHYIKLYHITEQNSTAQHNTQQRLQKEQEQEQLQHIIEQRITQHLQHEMSTTN